jgi:hypothetical protein
MDFRLNSAIKSLRYLCHFAKSRKLEWTKIEELCFNRVCSKLHRVMSRAIQKPKQAHESQKWRENEPERS